MGTSVLVGTTVPSSGTVREYLASAAPLNWMLTDGTPAGGVVPAVQAIEITVWGGPTCHVPGGPSTRAGGKSTVLRVQNLATLWVDEMLEMLSGLSDDRVSCWFM